MLKMLSAHLRGPQPPVWIHLQYSCKKYPNFSITFVLLLLFSFFSRRGAERWDCESPQRIGSPSVSLMDVRCVWEEAVAWVCFMLVLSVMSREAAGDEQKPPWPPSQYLHFCFFLSPLHSALRANAPLPAPSCNILVLIKANKGKHSVMGEERKKFWFPGEPDSSRFTSSHYKSRGSLNGRMAVPCVNVSPSWLQRSSRRTALLLLTATVPNSMLRWSTSIACAVIQYQFGP